MEIDDEREAQMILQTLDAAQNVKKVQVRSHILIT